MELTCEQLEAVKRGEAVTVNVPEVEEAVVVMTAHKFEELRGQTGTIASKEDMDAARQLARELLPREKLKTLSKKSPPPSSWWDEDHEGLY